MANAFFGALILNSRYEYPNRHWELDPQGQPTQHVVETRCKAEFITPIPKPKNDADLQEVYDTERHLLYVACTRARDHLLVTSVEPASEFLDDMRIT